MSATAAATAAFYHSDNNLRRVSMNRRGGVCSSFGNAMRFHFPSKRTPIASSGASLFGDVLLTHRRRDRAATSDRSSRRGRTPRPIMEWQDCTVKMEMDVPASVAYRLCSDRESFPRWVPFISSVKVMEDKPDLSRWCLKYNVLGIDVEYSWVARNMQPILDQKIHWRSIEGLPNRGVARFYPKGASGCLMELTTSYEVPLLLVPVASALKPFVEGLLRKSLVMFATLAKSESI